MTSCRIESVLAARIGNATPQDCGRLPVNGSDTAYRAARDCASMAANAGRPFVVLWDLQGIDSRVATAFLGLDEGGAFTIYQLGYDGDPYGGGGEDRPRTVTLKCNSITNLGDCSTLRSTLCLQCNDVTPAGTCSSI